MSFLIKIIQFLYYLYCKMQYWGILLGLRISDSGNALVKAAGTKKTPSPSSSPETVLKKSNKKFHYETDPFAYLDNNNISLGSDDLNATAASWYQFIRTLSYIGLLISFIGVALILFFNHSKESRAEAKSAIISKIIIFTIIIAFVSIIGWVYTAVLEFA